MYSAAESASRDGSLIEILLLKALARDARGHRAAAVDCLVEAVTRAPEPDGYLRLFLDEGAAVTALLRAAHLRLGDRGRRILEHVPSVAGRPLRSLTDPLSARELQVLRLLEGELTGPEIARALFVSHNTLRSHTKHIFTKLDVTNRRAALRRAHELGLI